MTSEEPTGDSRAPAAGARADGPAPVMAPALPYSAGDDAVVAWPFEAKAILLAAAIDSFAQLLDVALTTWVSLRSGSFQTIRADWGFRSLVMTLAYGASFGAALAGAVALLSRGPGRQLLLAAAAGCVLLRLYGFVATWFFPPPDFPRYRGPDFVVLMAYDVARLCTLAAVYVLVVFVLTRPYAKMNPRPR